MPNKICDVNFIISTDKPKNEVDADKIFNAIKSAFGNKGGGSSATVYLAEYSIELDTFTVDAPEPQEWAPSLINGEMFYVAYDVMDNIYLCAVDGFLVDGEDIRVSLASGPLASFKWDAERGIWDDAKGRESDGNLVLTASIEEEDNIILTGASFDDISSRIRDGKLVVFKYIDEEHEGYTITPISSAFFDDAQDLYVLQMIAFGEEMMVYAVDRTDTIWTSEKPTPPTPDEEDNPPTN